MKALYLVMLFTFSIPPVITPVFGFNISSDTYYWYGNKKVVLKYSSNKKYLAWKNQNIDLPNKYRLQKATFSKTLIKHRSNEEQPIFWSIVEKEDFHYLEKDKSKLIYEAPFVLASNGKEVGLSHLFYVKLKNSSDEYLLEKLAEETGTKILGNNSFMPLWYIVSCSNISKGNSLEMANYFYETGLFNSAEPSFVEDNLQQCVNDSYFTSNQWHLINSTYIGRDISYCSALDVSQGCSNIVIAIIDSGVQLTHPDLSSNIHSTSYNAPSGTSPSIVHFEHGTAVAGVAAATTNNNLGVAGVAPNAQIMSISVTLQPTSGAEMDLADGINFAWQNGAHIINNSWKASIETALIDDAIADAVTFGRGGLGCVVVCATGNDNDNSISFPASNSSTIAVGGTGNMDFRASFSNYGTGLDVVAPAENIFTTDLQGSAGYNTSSGTAGDYVGMYGTSFAAPIVSGIAALVLSMNPGLTQAQVRNIIESTTDKQISGYSFTYGAGENGTLTWNNQVGYGRVNAYKAMERALGGPIGGPNEFCSNATYSLPNSPPYSASWSRVGSNVFNINSSTGYATHTNNGQAIVQATMTTTCGTATLRREVSTGTPLYNYIIAETGWIGSGYGKILHPTADTEAEAGFTGVSTISEYGWEMWDHSNYSITPLSTEAVRIDYWHTPTPYNQRILIRAKNMCGWGQYQETFWTFSTLFSAYTVSPNPASDHVMLLFEDIVDPKGIPDYAELFHESSTIPVRTVRIKELDIGSIKSNGNKLSLDVRDLKRGIYYLHVSYENRKEPDIHRVLLK